MKGWDDFPLSGEEGLTQSMNGIMMFGIFLTGGVSSELNAGKNLVTRSDDVLGHIFRDKIGHVSPSTVTSQNRYLILFEKVGNNAQNANPNVLSLFQKSAGGFEGFSQTYRSGKQVWAQVRNGKIINAG